MWESKQVLTVTHDCSVGSVSNSLNWWAQISPAVLTVTEQKMVRALLLLLLTHHRGQNMVGFTLATSHVDISVLGDFITCYTDVEGLEETRCSFSEGFTTCYTSYDISESNKADVYIWYSVSNSRQTSGLCCSHWLKNWLSCNLYLYLYWKRTSRLIKTWNWMVTLLY